ncbi:MAG: ABC transporter ATP-binding protein [candidate division Zixibacteria bacterium]|jgi:ABC-type multidrug transport system fused ATPase/permease subunit|nr:ABC transporter ATP-binding protein [candidate division Zixibacteria bacterium]
MTAKKSKVQRLWCYLRPYWGLELLTLFVMTIIAALALVLPGAVRYLIDDLIPTLLAGDSASPDITPIVMFGLFLVGVYLANVLFSWVRDYLAGYIGAHIIADMRTALFAHLQSLSLQFHQNNQVGEIMSRILSDVSRVQSLLTSTLLMFFTNILLLVAILIYLLNVNWYLTVIAIIPVPLTVVITSFYGRRLNRISRWLQEAIASLSGRIQESFTGIKTVKAFGQENREGGRLRTIVDRITRLYVQISVNTSLSVNVVQFISMLGPIVVLAWGTYLIAQGQMQLGALIAFYMLLTYLYSPVEGLASLHIEVKSAMASVDRIFEYLDIPATVVEPPNPVVLSQPRGEVELRHVRFAYEGSNGFRLEGINLRVAAREKVAIVGPSGSGKTTIINLIMRFFDPDDGTVTLDGVDLRNLSLTSLRSAISIVDQEPLLFRATIHDNIAFGVPTATEADVHAAARIANIGGFIDSLPDKYQHIVGERGVTISGGEKQRLCLARVILKNPAVVILDEATSALDANSEYLIQQALEQVLVDKTAIIIAHRLSTIKHVDRIVALDRGRIVDEGRHDVLMERSALYRELVAHQLKN